MWDNSPVMTVMPRPKLKPTMTGREMKSVTHPRRRIPNNANQAPAASATPAVSAAARAGSWMPCIPAMTAPDISATVEVGPTETWREEPKIA